VGGNRWPFPGWPEILVGPKSHFSCWPIFNVIEFSIQSNFNRTPFQWSVTFITFINHVNDHDDVNDSRQV
jgi:hypothetical protein